VPAGLEGEVSSPFEGGLASRLASEDPLVCSQAFFESTEPAEDFSLAFQRGQVVRSSRDGRIEQRQRFSRGSFPAAAAQGHAAIALGQDSIPVV
jgi:hypothetical protein